MRPAPRLLPLSSPRRLRRPPPSPPRYPLLMVPRPPSRLLPVPHRALWSLHLHHHLRRLPPRRSSRHTHTALQPLRPATLNRPRRLLRAYLPLLPLMQPLHPPLLPPPPLHQPRLLPKPSPPSHLARRRRVTTKQPISLRMIVSLSLRSALYFPRSTQSLIPRLRL